MEWVARQQVGLAPMFAIVVGSIIGAGIARTRQNGAPVYSQCLAGALGIGLILLNSDRSTAGLFTFIILVATVGTLVMYLLGSAAQRTKSSPAERTIMVVRYRPRCGQC